MSQPPLPLPTNRAFVVQLRAQPWAPDCGHPRRGERRRNAKHEHASAASSYWPKGLCG
jgi:hypothetical protein